MKHLLLLVMAVTLVGCGDSPTPIKDAWEDETHTCFFCKEAVKLGALKCKYCHEDPYNGKEKLRALHHIGATGELDEEIAIIKEEKKEKEEAEEAYEELVEPLWKKERREKRWMWGVGIGVIAVIGLVGWHESQK